MFSTTLVSALGAVLAAVLYLFVTAAAFGSEGYAIYFTNDYLAMLSWFAGVVALRRKHWWLAALAAFAGAWAKETAMLIVFLAGFEALRRRAPWSAAIACGIAFAIPTLDPADDVSRAARAMGVVGHLQAERAVPRVAMAGDREGASRQPQGAAVPQRHVVWAWRAWRRTQDAFVVSLGLTLACYVVLAWMVVYIRELRHMLPFTILVIPLAVAELEAVLALGRRTPRRTAVEPPRERTRICAFLGDCYA